MIIDTRCDCYRYWFEITYEYNICPCVFDELARAGFASVQNLSISKKIKNCETFLIWNQKFVNNLVPKNGPLISNLIATSYQTKL